MSDITDKNFKSNKGEFMSNKQIEEMAIIIARRSSAFRNPNAAFMTTARKTAESLHNTGYRKQEWISVEDRLPESEQKVIVSAVGKTFGKRWTIMAAHIGHHEITTEEYGWREFEGDTEYDEENDCFWIPECWYESNSVEGNNNWIIDDDFVVTHWMPLPEAPKMRKEDERK